MLRGDSFLYDEELAEHEVIGTMVIFVGEIGSFDLITNGTKDYPTLHKTIDPELQFLIPDPDIGHFVWEPIITDAGIWFINLQPWANADDIPRPGKKATVVIKIADWDDVGGKPGYGRITNKEAN